MGNCNSKETSLKFIQEWMDNKTLLKAIVDCNRIDFLYNSHAKYIGNNMVYFFPNLSIPDEQLTYMLMIMTACTSACLSAWIKNGRFETAEQLQNKLSNCFKTLSTIFN